MMQSNNINNKTYNRKNFHNATFCEFVEVENYSNINWHYKSKSGSRYFFTDIGVYRISNHWGRVANCRWRLVSNNIQKTSLKCNNSKQRIGYAEWKNFFPNNDVDKLFYINVNFVLNEVTFHHKNNPEYDGITFLRSALECAKVIRQVKEILLTNTWIDYLDVKNSKELKQDLILKLISSNSSIQDLKKQLFFRKF